MSDKKEAVYYTNKAPVRAGFVNVLEARQFKKNGQAVGAPKYDATFIYEPDSPDLDALKKLVIPMLQAANPGKKVVPRRLTQEELDAGNVVEVSVPWKDGTKEADKAKAKGKDMEFARGKIVVKANSKYPPALAAIENGKLVEFTDANTRASLTRLFYSGAWFVPQFQPHAYNAQDEKPGGVGLYLPTILFAKHGEKLVKGGPNAAEVFKGYAGTVSTVDPTAGATDNEF